MGFRLPKVSYNHNYSQKENKPSYTYCGKHKEIFRQKCDDWIGSIVKYPIVIVKGNLMKEYKYLVEIYIYEDSNRKR